MSAIYNLLLPSYVPKSDLKTSVHKRSELRNHYNNIIKMTKNSPLYLIKLSDSKQTFALGIKEMAMDLSAATKELSGANGIFDKKKAISEDEGIVTAEIVEGKEEAVPTEFTIKVDSLARPQINTGNSYYATGKGVKPGEYTFRIKIEDNEYEFRYSIEPGMQNLEITRGLEDFINKADIGLQAFLNHDRDKVQLTLQSAMTGDTEGLIFELTDTNVPEGESGIVDFYGLNHFTQTPRSAKFQMNGQETKALSNRFVLNSSLQVTLNKASDKEIGIGYQADGKEAVDKVEEVLSHWNHLMERAYEYANSEDAYPKLANELRVIYREFGSELEASGIMMDEKGKLSTDRFLALQSTQDGDMQKLFSKDSGFLNRLLNKTNSIATDPMEYVDKKIVSYPNIKKQGWGYTYMTSMYSGMLFNYYC